ncbi:pyridoxal 5'-phosphate synthase glutaminase subunit PdxT [Timonella sp. A28]|uniref:pyridoxal 5'-phosphate synthase glutaminase subunit PdxT n=1 Tax=Timonella sp. A28 TaxID=3442640 RepID=UPI003EBB23B5
MTSLRVGVLALQGAVSEHEAMLSRLGAIPVPVRKPEHLDTLDALIIPGGESTAIARLAAPTDLLGHIRDLIAAHNLPVLGTCAGLILLADDVTELGALEGYERIGGLDVTVRRNGYGGQLASFLADVELTDEATASVAFIRAPIIEQVGPHAHVIATHNGHAVAVRQGNIFGATFHPEITEDTTLHSAFLAVVAQAVNNRS